MKPLDNCSNFLGQEQKVLRVVFNNVLRDMSVADITTLTVANIYVLLPERSVGAWVLYKYFRFGHISS
eukprot:snap_masked-scaffold_3-processed-gene-2.37-mRNA-1 protein AED:1.00 eAED:1.00 QI:0/0/0/0/1/1/2/0/67